MTKRVFSRETYNGYHLVSLGNDPDPLGFFKKSKEKDEFGNKVVEDDLPKCSYTLEFMFSPWDNWLYVPRDCQDCSWVYRIPISAEFDCLLKTRQKVNPACLINAKV
jgi:hypothetical protein